MVVLNQLFGRLSAFCMWYSHLGLAEHSPAVTIPWNICVEHSSLRALHLRSRASNIRLSLILTAWRVARSQQPDFAVFADFVCLCYVGGHIADGRRVYVVCVKLFAIGDGG